MALRNEFSKDVLPHLKGCKILGGGAKDETIYLELEEENGSKKTVTFWATDLGYGLKQVRKWKNK